MLKVKRMGSLQSRCSLYIYRLSCDLLTGLFNKAQVLELREKPEGIKNKGMPNDVKDEITEAVFILWQHSALEMWLNSHAALGCLERSAWFFYLSYQQVTTNLLVLSVTQL